MASITEVTILHHVCIVLIVIWLLNSFNYGHPLVYFISLIYLYLVCITRFCFFFFWFLRFCGLMMLIQAFVCVSLKVNEQYVTRLKKKLQFEEKRQSNQRRVSIQQHSLQYLYVFLVLFDLTGPQRILMDKKYKKFQDSKSC